MTCTYDENLRRVELILQGRSKRIARIEHNRNDPRFKPFWDNCRMMIKSIAGCGCDQCMAKEVFDAMDGGIMVEDTYDEIARIGYAEWKKRQEKGGSLWMVDVI